MFSIAKRHTVIKTELFSWESCLCAESCKQCIIFGLQDNLWNYIVSGMCQHQRQTEVTAYFTSKQLLLFAFDIDSEGKHQ